LHNNHGLTAFVVMTSGLVGQLQLGLSSAISLVSISRTASLTRPFVCPGRTFNSKTKTHEKQS